MPITADQSPLLTLALSGASSGANNVIAAVSGQTIRVYAFWATAAGAVTLQWRDGATTALSGIATMATGVTVSFPPTAVGNGLLPIFTLTAGNALNMNLGGAVQVSGQLLYSQS